MDHIKVEYYRDSNMDNLSCTNILRGSPKSYKNRIRMFVLIGMTMLDLSTAYKG